MPHTPTSTFLNPHTFSTNNYHDFLINLLLTSTYFFFYRFFLFPHLNTHCCSYEPELHPGATYRFEAGRAVLKIFQTGALTITAPSISNVQLAVEHIYPLVFEFKKEKPAGELKR